VGGAEVSSISSVDALTGATVTVRLSRSDLEALLHGHRVEIDRDRHGAWSDEPVAKVTLERI
jgi:hypothetical protein